jgi:hypothetical protein
LPSVVATIGLHSSASTWVFNVARELLIAARGEAAVLALYGERVEDLPAEVDRAGRFLVLKSHHGSDGLDQWLTAGRAVLLLSLRDPRDAALSMAQRFGAPLGQAAGWIANDCRRLARLVAAAPLLLRYEDRFFDDPAIPGRVARALGLAPDPAAEAAVFARYATAAVRRFADNLPTLPPERLASFGPTTVDRVTQIHRRHIGDARSGKWRDLAEPERGHLSRFFRPFLDHFGYES